MVEFLSMLPLPTPNRKEATSLPAAPVETSRLGPLVSPVPKLNAPALLPRAMLNRRSKRICPPTLRMWRPLTLDQLTSKLLTWSGVKLPSARPMPLKVTPPNWLPPKVNTGTAGNASETKVELKPSCPGVLSKRGVLVTPVL